MKTSIPVWVDLLQTVQGSARLGVQWAHECEDLDATLLCWNDGHRIAPHINDEVDNWLIGLNGNGLVRIGDGEHELRPGVALLIPRGSSRSIQSTSDSFSYLSIHKRRRGLMPTVMK